MMKERIDYCFGDRLKEAMALKGLEGQDFDDLDIVSAASVREYLEGRRIPNLRTAARMADFLGVSLDWLCGIGEDSPWTIGR